MFRIRRVYDDVLPIDAAAIAQVQEILQAQFPEAPDEDIAGLPQKLVNPFKHRFRALLFVADNHRGDVRGFALVLHEPQLRFWFLDYIAANVRMTGGGVGGALYARLREEATASRALGIFFECPPDDRDDCPSQDIYRQNVARLRFYERFGARPIINNAFRAPMRPGQKEMPYLVFDGLGGERTLRRAALRNIVRAILELKYGHRCTPDYISRVVTSFRDDPPVLRPFKYIAETAAPQAPPAPAARKIPLIVNDRHDIHHVRDRGYVEAPVRIRAILAALEPTGMFERIEPRAHGEEHIRAVHAGPFVDYLKRACANVGSGKSVYPYVFPLRNSARPPKELSIRAGYYCIDTFTPLNGNAYPAARRAVDCTLSAAETILAGERVAYALVRPPGHHAEHNAFGGFCYFNNAAVAAHYFSRQGRVAMLDIDYHHGNGQERIFYDRKDVLTVSIHGHPSFAYPYFSGFAEERGAGDGEGFNINFPLPERVDGPKYRATLKLALTRITRFAPRFLVVALGLDPAKGDPTGTWTLGPRDFEENGRLIGRLRLPTLVVQEGGYRTRTLGVNARRFFTGLRAGQEEFQSPAPPRSAPSSGEKHG